MRVLLAAALTAALAAGCGDRAPAPGEPRAPADRPDVTVATATATATGARSAAARPRPRTVRFTVGVSGDLLPHLPIVARARALAGGRGYDFAPMLRRVRRWVRRTDLAFCHVETPLTAGAPAGYPVFSTPTALARAVHATGWDACSTASNHALDRGQAGVAATIRALHGVGVRHAGTARSRRGRRRPLLLRVKGVRVAFLAYTTTTNGIPRPHPWSVNLAHPRRILRDARRARRAGARAVIVNLHWGTEYSHRPDAVQRRLARRLTRSGAITAIVGQHAHVVQPIRRVRGRWVVFGTGNLLSNQTEACCPAASRDGMLVRLHLRVRGRRARVERIRYLPTAVRHPDYTVVRARGESRRRTVAVAGRGRGLRPVP